MLRYATGIDQPIVAPYMPMVFDLGSDQHEDFNLMSVKMDMGWILVPAFREIAAFNASLAKYPNIKPGQDFDGYPPTT